MRTHSFLLAIAGFVFLAFNTSASVLYVDLNSTNPTPPYADWSTAATTIQDAIDASMDGDQILVTDGIYQTGGQVVYGSLTNRVVIDKAVTVQSVNGPVATMIQGYQDADSVAGDDAVRCVYLTNNAVLSGFTLTNGATRAAGDGNLEQSGGGVWCESSDAIVTNCVLMGNTSATSGGGSYQGSLNNCVLIGNSSGSGGGAFGGVLNGCTLDANSADNGGGACSNALDNCTLTANFAYVGCGADSCTVNNCILSDNGGSAASVGGGANNCTLNRCQIINNWIYWGAGGGVNASIVNDCILWNNFARGGSGAESSILNNCTLVANQVGGSEGWYDGGAADACTLNNCILYYNDGDNGNYNNCDLYYCCTTPLPTIGVGNIADEPLFVDLINSDFHLQSNSPCINMGNNAYVTSNTDFDGNPRIFDGTVDIGAYEIQTVIPLRAAIQVDFTNAVAGFVLHFIGSTFAGPATTSQWDFGDGTVTSNQLSVSHSWKNAGNYLVVFTAFNDANPGGISATATVFIAVQSIHYVSLASTNSIWPYLSWETATTNIQNAVDAAYAGGTIWVSNGVYQTGMESVDGSTSNRVTVIKPLVMQSVGRPDVTVIDGNGALRCIYLANGAALIGFTLTNGSAVDGGGLYCESYSESASNCIIAGCSAGDGGGAANGTLKNCLLTGNSGGGGGGAAWSVLNNCTLTNNEGVLGGGVYECNATGCLIISNYAEWYGGGASGSTLNNCVLIGNVVTSGLGGGADASTLNNCTVCGNWSPDFSGSVSYSTANNCIVYFNSGNNYDYSTLNYCCTTPDPGGIGNITNDPVFGNLAGDDFHLQPNSPCINAGNNAYVSGVTDLDGNPRIFGGTVDMGAYEFQSLVPLQAIINPDSTNVIFGFPLNLTGSTLGGLATNCFWNFGDGSAATNQFSISHIWSATGDYPVLLTVFNDDNPGGVSATVTVHVVTEILYYVDANGTNPVAPYSSQATAATNIQDVVNAASLVGATVVVNDGVYAPFSANSPINIQSVNGSATTIINGGGVQRCVYLGGDATLAGFTLTNGMDTEGGGVYCESSDEVLSNCVLIGNLANDSGGGAYQGTLKQLCTGRQFRI